MGASRTQRPVVEVVGAGVVGLTAAAVLAERGAEVRLVAASAGADAGCCSWWAGGMLAPYCEMERAEPEIGTLGAESIAFWRARSPEIRAEGTLVLAPPRDRAELDRFAERTEAWRAVGPQEIAALEPDLAERFSRGLFFETELHMDPRRALARLAEDLARAGVALRFGERLPPERLASPPEDADWRLDCRGLAARDQLPDLRGVRGEMLLIRSREVRLTRVVRLLHPRHPIYVTPRDDGVFMVGATQIESEATGRPTLRSALELMSAAYALHPAFGEAEILEIGADARPAFPDNLPRLVARGRTLYLNGMHRHGFLAAPAMARRAADRIFADAAEGAAQAEAPA